MFLSFFFFILFVAVVIVVVVLSLALLLRIFSLLGLFIRLLIDVCFSYYVRFCSLILEFMRVCFDPSLFFPSQFRVFGSLFYICVFLLFTFLFYRIGNTEKFVETLTKELSDYERANAKAMLDSKALLENLVGSVQMMVSSVGSLGRWMMRYNKDLKEVQEDSESLEKKNRSLESEIANYRSVIARLEDLFDMLSLPSSLEARVRVPSFSAARGHVERTTEAVKELERVLFRPLPEAFQGLEAVREKRDHFEKLAKNFCAAFCSFMRESFAELGQSPEV